MHTTILISEVGMALLAVFGVIFLVGAIGGISFLIYRNVLRPKLKDDNEKLTEQEAAKQELDRVLQPVEDEETAKQISEYREKDE